MSAHESNDAAMDEHSSEEEAMLDEADAAEEIDAADNDEDVHMDSDGEEDEEILLQNDSSAHFDQHKDSIFCIAQHPVHANIVVTGGGDDVAYIWDSTPPPRPVLPASYQSNPQEAVERVGQVSLAKLDGHEDSVNAVAFSLPKGQYVLTAGLDGRLRSYQGTPDGTRWKFLAEAREVEEINWLASCPHSDYKNTLALGASDGSVWVYTVNAADKSSPMTIVNTFVGHTAPCTAGAWSPDGKLLATVSEDGSLFVWDVFGEAAAAGLMSAQQGGQSVVSLTAADERFKVEGGLYSVAVAPNATFVAVGGAEGHIRIVGLPRFGEAASGAKGKAGSGSGQAGQILASLQAQSDSVESLSFASPPLTLMAAGSVDGSIALFDSAHRFAVRRHIKNAHDEEAVIKVEFVKSEGADGRILTSAGNDGVIRRWDTRGGTAAAAQGLMGEWKGHRGGGEGGGVLGFVQTREQIVTAGDDFISLVFETPA